MPNCSDGPQPDPDFRLKRAAARGHTREFRKALATDPRKRAYQFFLMRYGRHGPSVRPVWRACLKAISRKAGRRQIDPNNPWPMIEAVITLWTRKAGRWRGKTIEFDVARCDSPGCESAAAEQHWTAELEAVRNACAARIDPTAWAVFQAVAAFTASAGTSRGALTAVAAPARLKEGRLVLNAGPPADRDRRVYTKVRKAYRAAHAHVILILDERGIDVPPTLRLL